MAEQSWTKRAIDEFFKARTSPTQTQCDQTARLVAEASAVRPVDIPGSLSYTVICTSRYKQQKDIVVSFREAESGLDSHIVQQAREMHGYLVPETKYHGMMSGADPQLGIYAMSYLPGIPCLDVFGCESQMDSQDEARHVCYVKHLAR